MRNGILCGGNLVLDLIKVIDGYPTEGMLTDIISESRNGGGAIINVLVDLATMDSSIPLFATGLLGEDDNAKFLLEELKSKSIDTSGITTTNKAPTSFTDVMANKQNGNRTFFHQRGTNSLLSIEHVLTTKCNAKIFHLGYLLLLDKLDSSDDEYGTKAAKLFFEMQKRGFKTSADLVSVENENLKQIVIPSLKYLNYLIINEIEAEKCTDIIIRKDSGIDQYALKEACTKLLDHGIKELVAIHFPEGGYLLSRRGEEFFVPSQKVSSEEIKGTVGAGDAFCAGMLYSIHEEFDFEMALRIANTSAWFNLHHQTSTGGAVSMDEIKAQINNTKH